MSSPLPCPFCGGASVEARDAASGRQNWVECLTPLCGAMGPNLASANEAVRGWNRRALAAPPAGPSVTAEPDFTPRGTALWNEVIGVVFQASTKELPTNLATAAIVRIFERHQQAAAPPAGVGAETCRECGNEPMHGTELANGLCDACAPAGTGGRR